MGRVIRGLVMSSVCVNTSLPHLDILLRSSFSSLKT